MAGRLIVNADDFGASPAVNAAVIRGHEEGVLTSASLMVTGDAAEEAIALARAHPRLAVGLHLALTEVRPALPPETLPHLVDADGRLPRDPLRAGLRWAASAAARRELRREIAAQLARFAASGLPLSHVDGHQHLHLHPAAFPAVAELAARHGARGVRLPSAGLASLRHASAPGAAAEGLAIELLARGWRRTLRRRGLAFAGEVHGLARSGAMEPGHVAALVRGLRGGTAEIYLHPATEGEVPRGPNPRDLTALLSPEVRAAIAERGLTLCTYATLGSLGRAPEAA